MLTEEQIFENKKKYLELLSKLNIDLTEISKYLDYVDYFYKPASNQYQRCYAGGLCEQALLLYHELSVLCNAYYPGRYTEEDVIKVALFKELYRAEMYEQYNKNVKNETTGQWETQVAYRTKENRPTFGDLGFSSYMIAKYFVNFTDEQILAITHTTGINSYAVDIHDVLKSYPLVTLTKMADLVVNYIVEEK